MTNRNENGEFETFKDYSELRDYPEVKKWLRNVKNDRQRLGILQEYCNFLEMTPKQVIDVHHLDVWKADSPRDINDVAKEQLHSFFGHLTGNVIESYSNTLNDKERERTISINSAVQYVYSKLASFYSANNVPVNFGRNEKPDKSDKNVREKVWKENGNPIVRDERKECLKRIRDALPNVRDKAIFLCKKSSSHDDVDLFNLNISDFQNGYRENYGVCYLQGNRQKTGEFYQSFFDSEACEMLKIYFEDRKRKGEELTPARPLFVSLLENDGEYTRLKNGSFSKHLRETCKMLNISNVTPKSLRRWFKTEMSSHGIKKGVYKRLMGQKTNVEVDYDDDFNYAKEGVIEPLMEIYVEEIEHITLLGNGGRKLTTLDKEVAVMKEKITQLMKEKDEMLVERTETKKRVSELNEIVAKQGKMLDLIMKKLKK